MDAPAIEVAEGARPLPADAGTLRELLRVSIPLIISSGSLSVMGIIDRMLLTGLSIDALSASMPAGMLHWTVLSLPFGVVTYVNTFVSQFDGAGRKDRVAACIWQGLWLSLIGGLIIAGLIPVVVALIPYNGHPPAVQQLEIQYYTILALGSAPILATNVFSAFFAGRGRTVIVMCVNLGAMVGNGLLDYTLIFGKFGLPAFGMAGAALATVLANILSCGVFAWLTYREARQHRYPFREYWRWNTELIWRMLRYGLPNGVQLLADVGAYLVFIVMTGVIGERELAATNLAFNLNSMAFIPMIGLGTAVLTLVGRRIGEQRPELAVRTTWLAIGLSAGYMLFFGILYVGVPEVLLAPYALFAEGSDRPEEFAHIQPIVIVLLRFVAAYSFFDAMAIIFGSAVRGAGDVRFSLIVTTLLAWFVMAVPCFFFATILKSDSLNACWGAATANIVLLGLILMWRFQQGHWRKMNVMH